MTQIALSGVAVEFGTTTLLQDVTFTVAAGEKWGVVGRNGTGKTTLFRLITGEMAPTRGAVSRASGVRVSLLEQHRDFGDATTVWEAAAGPFAELFALERSLAEQADALAAAGERSSAQMLARYARDLERFEREGGYTIAPRVDAVLHGLGFDPAEARTRPLEWLSGGERGRVGLARQLVVPADVLLLDEPTNHLDLETTRWLERYLRESSATVLVISHDRAFLASLVDHVLHVEANTATPYAGGYEAFVLQRTERRLSQQRQYDKQRRTVAHEEDYIRRNIAGQNSKQAKGRRKRLARLPRLSTPPSEDDAMSLRLEVGERGGDQVLVAEDVRIGAGFEVRGARELPREASTAGGPPPIDSVASARSSRGIVPPQPVPSPRTLIDHFTTQVRRGDVIGFVGPNGAGKSTLLRAIVGETAPAAGTLRLGGSITVAHYRQDMAQVPLDKTIYDVIASLRPLWTRGQVQGHLGRFGFSGDEVQRRADTLSGGERARVALAMMMLSRANLLLFDEPTNHLDVESIEALEDAIESYEGTVILVSHDRALLRALAERVWVLHEGRITVFDGGFDEWEVVSAEREHAASVQAAEEEALRRVREKKRVAVKSEVVKAGAGARDARRAAERAAARVAQLEGEVAAAESKVAELTRALEDPELYTRPDGPAKASALGVQLEDARRALDAALEGWAAATEALESPAV